MFSNNIQLLFNPDGYIMVTNITNPINIPYDIYCQILDIICIHMTEKLYIIFDNGGGVFVYTQVFILDHNNC